MFRNPRENAARSSTDQLQPSLGRPPSPSPPGPLRATDANITHSSPLSASTPAKPGAKAMASSLAQTARSAPTAASPRGTAGSKGANRNASILSFFKKTDKPEESIFVTGGNATASLPPRRTDAGLAQEEHSLDTDRFQEQAVPVKRRKLSHGSSTKSIGGEETYDDRGCTPPPEDVSAPEEQAQNQLSQQPEPKHRKIVGAFVDESDSESDNASEYDRAGGHLEQDDFLAKSKEPGPASTSNEAEPNLQDLTQGANGQAEPPMPAAPVLKRASTSLPELETDDFADFEGMDDFDEEYEDGEEFLNRRFMHEQGDQELDGAFEGGDIDLLKRPPEIKIEGTEPATPSTNTNAESGLEVASMPADASENASAVAACPICSVSFEGVTGQEASVHVNHCLDGNPTPLPKSHLPPLQPKSHPPPVPKKEGSEINANTFKRPSRPAKPGQSNPKSLDQSSGQSSAFSKLMSGHSEENAFAEAAASEKASHGKPSYQRTCPFYKILPGWSICVDAFRYGAVQGCNAYFLSHFHSDHYGGLTSSWSHGPIYCSDVTGRLVVQQLGVDPKYVVPLQWEEETLIPGTPGVHITMLPANHCPGSSIFLYEQEQPPVRQGGRPRKHRVLHCGDFRACPAHVEHPLLMPNIVDAVTGKIREQHIDVCYLDTTYLNPRWAFPSQEDVIKACSGVCAALNEPDAGAPGSLDDPLKKLLRGKDAGSMIKFVRMDSAGDSPARDSDHGENGKDDGNGVDDADPSLEDDDTEAARSDPPPLGLAAKDPNAKLPLLVVVGTYSIGKERMCLGIARALNSLIYAPRGKQRIVAALRDRELAARMTSDPRAAQVHMTPLFEIRPDTLAEYAATHSGRFARAVAFRPSGWNFRSPGARAADPPVADVLYSAGWKSTFSATDCVPQRGSTPAAAVFGVPYSEHSSFRELTMFVSALRIDRVIPTVNVGSAVGRAKMKGWVERWLRERRRSGLFQVVDPETGKSNWYPGEGTWALRTTI